MCPNHFICLVIPLPARLLQHLFPLELREADGFLHFMQLPSLTQKRKKNKKTYEALWRCHLKCICTFACVLMSKRDIKKMENVSY